MVSVGVSNDFHSGQIVSLKWKIAVKRIKNQGKTDGLFAFFRESVIFLTGLVQLKSPDFNSGMTNGEFPEKLRSGCRRK